jgi:hypothetical protein
LCTLYILLAGLRSYFDNANLPLPAEYHPLIESQEAISGNNSFIAIFPRSGATSSTLCTKCTQLLNSTTADDTASSWDLSWWSVTYSGYCAMVNAIAPSSNRSMTVLYYLKGMTSIQSVPIFIKYKLKISPKTVVLESATTKRYRYILNLKRPYWNLEGGDSRTYISWEPTTNRKPPSYRRDLKNSVLPLPCVFVHDLH